MATRALSARRVVGHGAAGSRGSASAGRAVPVWVSARAGDHGFWGSLGGAQWSYLSIGGKAPLLVRAPYSGQPEVRVRADWWGRRVRVSADCGMLGSWST